EGRAQVLAGRIISIRREADSLAVAYLPRGSMDIKALSTSAVINCVGPCADIQRLSSPLMGQLLTDGVLQPGVHGFGLMVTPDLEIVDSHQQPVEGLWYVGPLLKGLLWEATAVPELRVHAQRLACHLLNTRPNPQHTSLIPLTV